MKDLLPDLLAPNLKLLFCGTAPSTASAAAKAYYAKPGNKFWPSLHAVGITPRQFAPAEYRTLLTLSIGFTDLCKHVAGTDAQLPKDAFDVDAVSAKLKKYTPAIVAFTSKNAAQSYLGHGVEYGWQRGQAGEATAIFVLPSPSGLATRFFNIAIWQELADAIK